MTRLSCSFYIFFANSITRARRGSQTILVSLSPSVETMERRNSTPPSAASQDTMKINSDGQGGQFAFLVHSQDSVSQNTPPDVDDQRLTRQRRRRTRYNPHNIRHEDCCLLSAFTAPRIMPFSKPNTRRTPNLTRPQESRLWIESPLERKKCRQVQLKPETFNACFDTASVAMLLRIWADLAAPRYGSKIDDR